MKETCMIVDGNSLMYRAFHALPSMDVNGVYTNAVHGFLMMLLKALEDYHPEYCCIAFDEHGPTFRHTDYEEYKAGRAPTPDELRPQFPLIKEILTAMGLGVISLQGYEADDLLGTISQQCNQKDIRALLLTGDRDALQLVSEKTNLLFTRKGISEIVLYDPKTVESIYGVAPSQVTDWKGLMGDSSDNIPGIPGVGEKTSVKLLKEYGTLENVLDNAENIKGKLGENIRNNKEQAVLSKRLATIRLDVPISYQLKDWSVTRLQDGLDALKKYQLNTIMDRVTRITGAQPEKAADAVVWQTADSGEKIGRFISSLRDGPVALLVEDDEITLSQGTKGLRIALAAGQQSLFDTRDGLTYEEALKALTPVFKKQMITHDGKALFHRLSKLGLPLPALLWDTMVAAYLISPLEKSYALQAFASRDSGGVEALYQEQYRQMENQNMLSLYQNIELPLIRVLFDMEQEGFQVDAEVLRNLGNGYTGRADALQQNILRSANVGEFNINSPQQLGKVLFEDLGLPTRRKTTRGYSTDAATLESLLDLHPVVQMILDYRQVAKLNSTYIEPMLRKMDKSGRIHTTFDQTVAATGRISSNDPNLQNIPVRTDMGREIRRAFIAREGHVLVDGDYSQIELRILAHMSGDKSMSDAFLKQQDVHTRTAAEVNGVPMDKVTPDMRAAAKAVNFGIVYGISDFGLARNIGISRKEAADFIKTYFHHYPGVHEYMERAKEDGYKNGYAETLYGRRRPLPELSNRNFNIRSFGERAAMNTPIQGTAADIIKAAMVKVHAILQEKGLKSRLILQVHDELIIEAPLDEKEIVAVLLKTAMENVIALNVPLVCDVNIGSSWYESK